MTENCKAKTSTQRSRDRRKKLREDGWKELRNLWLKNPNDEEKVKKYVESLNKKA